MNIEFKIRPYSSNDFDSLVEMTNQLQNHFVSLDLSSEIKPFFDHEEIIQYTKQALKDVQKMDGVVYVAEQSGGVVGFIQGVIIKHDKNVMHNFTHYQGAQGWIGLFFIDPKFRGRGIGKALLDKIKDYFESKGCQSLRLKVMHSNEQALNLYENYGFTPRDIEMAMKI